jgi:hypothetical protein
MWTDVIVLFEPPVDDDLRLLSRRELFCIEHLAAKGSVEAFSQGEPGCIESGNFVFASPGIGEIARCKGIKYA